MTIDTPCPCSFVLHSIVDLCSSFPNMNYFIRNSVSFVCSFWFESNAQVSVHRFTYCLVCFFLCLFVLNLYLFIDFIPKWNTVFLFSVIFFSFSLVYCFVMWNTLYLNIITRLDYKLIYPNSITSSQRECLIEWEYKKRYVTYIYIYVEI